MAISNQLNAYEVSDKNSNRLRQLKLVAQIAFSFSVIAAIALAVSIVAIFEQSGTSYSEMISDYSLTKERILPSILVSGTFIVLLTAIITAIVAKYSTFRIAGPLYRFSLDLKASLATGEFVSSFRIRPDDLLHEEARLLNEAAMEVEAHITKLTELRDSAEQALNQQPFDAEKAKIALSNFREEVSRAHYHD